MGNNAQSPSEQPALFSANELDDAALLLPRHEREKRYTAEQAMELDRLATAVLMLLPNWPVEAIASQLHLSTRTVKALAAQSAEKVAGFNKEFAGMLLRTGARWVGLARTIEHTANFRDLNIGAGIVMDHARELAAMGEGMETAETKEDADHCAAALELRRLMESTPGAGLEAGTADALSGGSSTNVEENPTISHPGAGSGAG